MDELLRACIDVKDADFLWAAGPLVRTSSVKVGLNLTEIDVEYAKRRRTVDERQHSAFTREPAELTCGQHVTDRARHMREGKHSCPRRDRPCRRFHEILCPGMWVGLTDDRDGVSEPLRLLHPRSVVAGVVVRKNHDFIAGFEVETARDDVVRLARVAGDDDLLRSHMEEPREDAARLFFSGAHLLPVVE